MGFSTEFRTLAVQSLHEDAASRKDEGWRYVQMLAVNNDESVDLVYSYMKDGLLDNAVIEALPKDASDVDPQAASADAELEAKLAAMPPEKAAKVRAAMEAKAAKAKKGTEGEGA